MKDPNEIAIQHCIDETKTLIFTKKTKFVPSIQWICAMRDVVYFTEENGVFRIFTENFDDYDAFIFVDQPLNDFEREFFRQACLRNNKKMVEIYN